MDSGIDDTQQSRTPSEVAETWTSSHETLLASIGDRANCSRWIHWQCSQWYVSCNFWLTLPSILATGAVGTVTANLPQMSPTSQSYVAFALACISLITSVLLTVNQKLQTAQLSEAHRAAAVAYGKLYNTILCELALRRDQRSTAPDFVKTMRADMDRLNATSPFPIKSVIEKFRRQFADRVDLEKPESAADLDHIQVHVEP